MNRRITMKNKVIYLVLLLMAVGLLFAAGNTKAKPVTSDMPKGQLMPAPFTPHGSLRTQNLISSTPIYEEDFEPAPTTWTIGAGWSIGQDPGLSGYSTPNSAYTDHPYAAYANYEMFSPLIQIPAATGVGTEYLLDFWSYWELESGYDYVYVDVYVNNTFQETVFFQTGTSGWQDVSANLSSYAGQSIQLCFRLTSDNSNQYFGWAIDNLRIMQNIYEITPDLTLLSLNTQNFPFVYSTLSVSYGEEDMSNLDASHFAVYENNVLQTNYFEVIPPSQGAGARLADIAFLMDNSGSMGSYQSAISANVTDFINNLAGSGVDCALGLCRYGSSYNSGNPFLEDSGVLTTNLNYFRDSVWPRNDLSGGYEPGYYAMTYSLANFNWRPGSQKVMIIITDETPDQGGAALSEALNACTANGAILFALTGSGLYSTFTPITEVTGGAVFDLYSNFNTILTAISEIIVSNYVISYRSSDPLFNGVQRNLRYQLNYQNMTALAEGSYVPGQTPMINRTQATIAMDTTPQLDNQNIVIQAIITDSYQPFTTGATLFYKNLGQTTWTSLSMSYLGDNLWQGTIPAGNVQAPGIGYYLTATDGQSTASLPSVEPTINPFTIAVLPNIPPQIGHNPPEQVMYFTPLTINANVFDNTLYIQSVELFYRRYGQLSYISAPMQFTGENQYSAAIPADIVASYGVEYYIRATDNYGMTGSSGFADNPHFVPALLDGVIIPGGPIADYTWDSDDSPFYINGTISVEPGNTLVIEPGTTLIFQPDTRLDVFGGIQATGVTFRANDPVLGWLGINLESASPQIDLNNCQIQHAVRGLTFTNTNGNVQNSVISKSNPYQNETGILVIDNSSPHFVNNHILGYTRGIVFQNNGIRTTTNPSLSNVRIRNTSSGVRPDSRGLEVVGAVGLSIDDAVLEDFDEGIFWDGQGTTDYRTTPSLTNVRIRNTSSGVRSATNGLKLIDLGSVIMVNDSIGGYPQGFTLQNNNLNRTTTNASLTNVRIRNTSSTVRNTGTGALLSGSIAATIDGLEIDDYETGFHFVADSSLVRTSASASLTNVRIRNTNSAVRTDSYGIKLEGAVLAQVNDAEINEYDYGLFYQGNGQTFERTTPSLSNVRIRNTSSTVRSANYGIKLIDLSAVTAENDTIEGYLTGFSLDIPNPNRTVSNASLSNVRIRNTSSSVRTETLGLNLTGSIAATLNGLEIEDYNTGIYYEGDGQPFNRTTPSLSNVRIRNTSSTVREPVNGIVLKNLAAVNLQQNIIYPDLTIERGNASGTALSLENVQNAQMQQNTIWGYDNGLSLQSSNNATFARNVIWTNGGELTLPISLDNSAVTVSNCCISVGGGVYPGSGNLDKNPLFADPLHGNFYLKPRSPLRDTGIGALGYVFDALAAVMPYNMHPAWNLMGVPYLTQPGQNTPVNIFADDLNPFYVAPTYTSIVQMNPVAVSDSLGHLRMTYNGNYNVPANVVPARGYWVRNPYANSTNVDIYGLLDDGNYLIELAGSTGTNNGWFLLANPYDVPIGFSDGSIAVAPGSMIAPWAYVYNYSANSYDLVGPAYDTDSISPWSGFFVKANQSTDKLLMNYPAAPQPVRNIEQLASNDLQAASAQTPEWELSLSASTAGNADQVYLGVAQSASEQYDPLDVPELPNLPFALQRGIDLSVLNSDWETGSGNYTRDIRDTDRNNWTWNLLLNVENLLEEGKLHDIIKLSAESKLPVGYRFALSNPATGQSCDLATDNLLLELNIEATGEGTPWLVPLRLEVCRNGFGQQSDAPGLIASSNYPNPFNPETTIRYSLGKDSPVTLEIYNLKGQLVNRLVNGFQKQGSHSVVWNGTDHQGRGVSSGFYFYRITAGEAQLSRKILLMK